MLFYYKTSTETDGTDWYRTQKAIKSIFLNISSSLQIQNILIVVGISYTSSVTFFGHFGPGLPILLHFLSDE